MTSVRTLAKRRQRRRQRLAAQALARIEARRRQLTAGRREISWSVGAELAKRATSLQFPPAPPAEDWEPPRVELKLRHADLFDEP